MRTRAWMMAALALPLCGCGTVEWIPAGGGPRSHPTPPVPAAVPPREAPPPRNPGGVVTRHTNAVQVVSRPAPRPVPAPPRTQIVPPPYVPPPLPAPRPAPAPLTPAPDTGLAFKRMLALQTALDRMNFSPGCIDGKGGRQTLLAIEAWRSSLGRTGGGGTEKAAADELADESKTTTTYVITSEDVASLTPTPDTWKEKAALPRMGYGTVLELVAEKFHASQAAIERLNPGVAWPDPPAGTAVKAPNPVPAARSKAAARLVVNIGRKYIRAFDAQDRLIAHFPCSIAHKAEKRPSGEATVITAAADPTYTFDPELFAEDAEAKTMSRKLVLPAGPNNPVGVAWIGLSLPGYGMHGTPKPEDIGKTESHGCFRLANWNAQKLFRMVRAGMPVQFEP